MGKTPERTKMKWFKISVVNLQVQLRARNNCNQRQLDSDDPIRRHEPVNYIVVCSTNKDAHTNLVIDS